MLTLNRYCPNCRTVTPTLVHTTKNLKGEIRFCKMCSTGTIYKDDKDRTPRKMSDKEELMWLSTLNLEIASHD